MRVLAATAVAGCLLVGSAAAAVPSTVPPPGIREHTPAVFALTGARVVVSPGTVLPSATVVIRDGVIDAVGSDVSPPADAVVHHLGGKTVYAGFIDAYTEIGVGTKPGRKRAERQPDRESWARPQPDRPQPDRPQPGGARYWNPNVTPQHAAARVFRPDSAAAAELRSQGFAAVLAAPSKGIIKGTSAVVLLGDGDARDLMLEPEAALHVNFWLSGDYRRRGYPNSPMGAYALVRQAFHDADWYQKAHDAWEKDPSLPRPETNETLAALQGYAGSEKRVMIDTRDEQYALRAARLAEEFELNAILRGSGREYRRLDLIAATGRPIVLPLSFPKAPPVDSPEEAINVSLEELMHWDIAPANPRLVSEAGIPFALTTDGLEKKKNFLARARKAVRYGLDADAALAALTVTPAGMLGLDRVLGTVAKGKLANLVVVHGDLFAEKSEIVETWVAGRRYAVRPVMIEDPRGTWELRYATPGIDAPPDLTITITGEPGKLKGTYRSSRGEGKLDEVELLDARVFFQVHILEESRQEVLLMSGTITRDALFGEGLLADGTSFQWTARRTGKSGSSGPRLAKTPPEMPLFPPNYPLGAFGRDTIPEQPSVVAFTGATVWTCGPKGRLDSATVIVRKGKVAAADTGLAVPSGALVIDCAGKHITPGIIDAHAHVATDGGINESGQTISAEVRISDFIDSNDISVYRQLAGGVTCSHVLHGSANVIGGQNQIIKLRWSAGPGEMKFEGAPPTIKFALGENPKQSNWGDHMTTRYPQTRMGVEQLLRDEFQAAREYRSAWASYGKRSRGVMPPRRDLELDAVVEILEGERLIHCHAYRQDEILGFLKVADDFEIKKTTFVHVLEGYKVADEIASRGFGATTFSDWWAYKIEVYDAIPYNGALMHNAGVVVSFNSDSDELARRLNIDAAKAVKYGGLSEQEALSLVTLYPAIQLGIEDRVGWLDEGKDADLAVWSGSPLSTQSICEQTWIDGRKYFDIEEDEAMRDIAQDMRAALIQRVLLSPDKDEGERREREERDDPPDDSRGHREEVAP
jgi:imidazolonepropionase-like amidohydrolase